MAEVVTVQEVPEIDNNPSGSAEDPKPGRLAGFFKKVVEKVAAKVVEPTGDRPSMFKNLQTSAVEGAQLALEQDETQRNLATAAAGVIREAAHDTVVALPKIFETTGRDVVKERDKATVKSLHEALKNPKGDGLLMRAGKWIFVKLSWLGAKVTSFITIGAAKNMYAQQMTEEGIPEKAEQARFNQYRPGFEKWLLWRLGQIFRLFSGGTDEDKDKKKKDVAGPAPSVAPAPAAA